MNSVLIALCVVLASVQFSYQQSPASIFDSAETGVVEISNFELAGQSAPTVPLSRALNAGETLEVKATATGTFSVNLFNKDNKNINGLHISLRTGCCVVLNWYSKFDKFDYSKESRPNLAKPAAGDYTILIHASTSNVWKIAINGAQTSYPVNIAYEKLDTVAFSGSVKVNSVRHLGRFSTSPVARLNSGKSSFRLFEAQSVTSANPVKIPALSVGSAILARIIPTDDSSLNLYNQASNRGINAFHMSFRFVTNHIVFNFHAKPNEWDYSEELQVPAAPAFVKDAEHALQIVCSSSGWIVSVNGNEFTRYPTHVPCDKADELVIVGGTRILSLAVYA